MKKFIYLILLTAGIVCSETLFEVKDSANNPVLNVSTDGLRVLNEGDTLMVISSDAIRANIGVTNKGLSRSFSVTTTSSVKGKGPINALEVDSKSATMTSELGQYTDFSPENIFIGLNAGLTNAGKQNVLVGNNAGANDTGGWSNVFIGGNAGYSNTEGDANVFIGLDAGKSNTNSGSNTYVGCSSGYSSTGIMNAFFGYASGYSNNGNYNSFFGQNAGSMNSSGSESCLFGYYAGFQSAGNQNTIIGTQSGYNNKIGSGNVFLGYKSGYNETGSNRLYIDNSNTSNPLIYGEFDTNMLKINGYLGVGTTPYSGYGLTVLDDYLGVYSYGYKSGSTTSTYGIYGVAGGSTYRNIGVYGDTDGNTSIDWAGYFSGNINVTGSVVKSKDEVKSDHPTDPENKILTHSSVSSSEMLNVYSGNVMLDDEGRASVEVPEWFEAYNAEFRYQLTGIGSSAPGLFISEELENGKFTIGGGNPGMKVSWMLTAVRNDNYAKANPVKVVSEKKENEKGYYLTPEVFGKSKDMSIESLYERETMKSISE